MKYLFLTFLLINVAQASDSTRMLGKFQIDLKIGNRVFIDYLETQRGSNGKIEGRYIVPNSFESPITKFKYSEGNFSFIIRVREGAQDYEALFEGFISDVQVLEGRAFILPHRQLLGTFNGLSIE